MSMVAMSGGDVVVLVQYQLRNRKGSMAGRGKLLFGKAHEFQELCEEGATDGVGGNVGGCANACSATRAKAVEEEGDTRSRCKRRTRCGATIDPSRRRCSSQLRRTRLEPCMARGICMCMADKHFRNTR